MEGGGRHKGRVSTPVGTSGCTYLFTFGGGILHAWIGGLVVAQPLGWGVKGVCSKIARGEEPAHDATATLSTFWNCPTRWHHDFGGRHLAFCFPGGHISISWKSGGGRGGTHTKKHHPSPVPRAGIGWVRHAVPQRHLGHNTADESQAPENPPRQCGALIGLAPPRSARHTETLDVLLVN